MQSLGISSQPTVPSLTIEPEIPGAPKPVYVGFGRRAAARLIDMTIHYAITFVSGIGIGIVILIISGVMDADPDFQLRKLQLITPLEERLFSFLGMLAYFSVCEGLHGSTLGKLLLGITVVREDLGPCNLASGFKRSLAFIWDGLFFGVVGYYAMAGSPHEQRNGDYWAETVVVTRKSVPGVARGAGRFILAFVLAAVADMAVIAMMLIVNLF
ncbi:MAG: RDD family protein [Acidobacteriales bacterium]|nr:RDD family protein [Terriglobales bacterium]